MLFVLMQRYVVYNTLLGGCLFGLEKYQFKSERVIIIIMLG
jgi:hypothetical protein